MTKRRTVWHGEGAMSHSVNALAGIERGLETQVETKEGFGFSTKRFHFQGKTAVSHQKMVFILQIASTQMLTSFDQMYYLDARGVGLQTLSP